MAINETMLGDDVTHERRQFGQKKRQKIFSAHNYRCDNCGSTEHLEIHHIVPVSRGGTDALTNLSVLCSNCHAVVHGGMRLGQLHRTKASGRPCNVNDVDRKEAFTRFLLADCGTSETKDALAYKENSRITDQPMFKEIMNEWGIVKRRNSIDLIMSKRGNFYGTVGYIMLDDGAVVSVVKTATGKTRYVLPESGDSISFNSPISNTDMIQLKWTFDKWKREREEAM